MTSDWKKGIKLIKQTKYLVQLFQKDEKQVQEHGNWLRVTQNQFTGIPQRSMKEQRSIPDGLKQEFKYIWSEMSKSTEGEKRIDDK